MTDRIEIENRLTKIETALDLNAKSTHKKLDEIILKIDKQNGRVSKLELWKERINTKVVVISSIFGFFATIFTLFAIPFIKKLLGI